MNQATRIAERYLAVWNEEDPTARHAMVAADFTPDAVYLDPMMRASGHDGILALIAGTRQHFPGHRFQLNGTPDGHNDVVRFSWRLCGPDGTEALRRTDIAALAADGRVARVTGFLDRVA